MANTYTQIYIQMVFALEGRQNLIQPEHNDELQKYITGIVSSKKQKQRHHARQTFREEYIEFLRKFQVHYNERYIFETA